MNDDRIQDILERLGGVGSTLVEEMRLLGMIDLISGAVLLIVGVLLARVALREARKESYSDSAMWFGLSAAGAILIGLLVCGVGLYYFCAPTRAALDGLLK